jgi:hypothetical protein
MNEVTPNSSRCGRSITSFDFVSLCKEGFSRYSLCNLNCRLLRGTYLVNNQFSRLVKTVRSIPLYDQPAFFLILYEPWPMTADNFFIYTALLRPRPALTSDHEHVEKSWASWSGGVSMDPIILLKFSANYLSQSVYHDSFLGRAFAR